MRLGLFSYNAGYGGRPDGIARAADERGFESRWAGERTHIPASRKTPYPGGDPLPKPHFHMDGPFVSLMAAASVTLLRERGFVWFHWIGQGIHYDVLATREKPNLTTA